MQEVKEKIQGVLVNDSTLLGMLPLNKGFWSRSSSSAKKNSILPFGMVNNKFNLPVITIQSGGGSRVGNKLYDEVVFIRCYNNRNKSYVEIQNILERISKILDGYNFSFNSSVHIKTIYEWAGSEMEDPTFGLNFQEIRFRLYVL